MRILSFVLLSIAWTCPMAVPALADEAEATPENRSVVVFLPEQIDHEWFWYYYTETSQHIVQSAVEKALLRDGIDVLDPTVASALLEDSSLAEIRSRSQAKQYAGKLGADYVITGKAMATRISHDVAYGVDVYRSSADVAATIIDVQSGQIVAVEDAQASAGSESNKSAAMDALKDAGKKIGAQLARAFRQLSETSASSTP